MKSLDLNFLYCFGRNLRCCADTTIVLLMPQFLAMVRHNGDMNGRASATWLPLLCHTWSAVAVVAVLWMSKGDLFNCPSYMANLRVLSTQNADVEGDRSPKWLNPCFLTSTSRMLGYPLPAIWKCNGHPQHMAVFLPTATLAPGSQLPSVF